MTSHQHQRAKAIFLAACEAPIENRDALVASSCGDDIALLGEVRSLLRFHDAEALRGLDPAVDVPHEVGDLVGRYRLLRRLGEGGMGIVYEAEQTEPLRRRVALKLIRVGMDTGEVLARFEGERQALALMDHPAIARVLDAGATEQGRPFFAMELVPGEPITAFCDRERLTIRERLVLFAEVCRGVQHAHQKGVIHRDLKPSNILVVVRDGHPEPKIIDFGIAKASGGKLTLSRGLTRLGGWVGTPEYMSPEQAGGGEFDVDTRSDVYSLGVVLYELLVGSVPFGGVHDTASDVDDVRRRIREEEPPRPSTRARTVSRGHSGPALARRLEPMALARVLRGDLDWITMKALEKDRGRRYASAAELAADLERYLDNRPVLAAPPTLRYQTAKFVRRHRAAVTAAVLVALALVAGIVGTSAGLLRARRETESARRVAATLEDVLAGADPAAPFGQTSSPVALLDRGVERISSLLAGQPVVQARLLTTTAWGYRNLGRYDTARKVAERALALQQKHLEPDHPDIAATLGAIGWIENDAGRLAESLAAHAEAVRILEARGTSSTTALAEALTGLAYVTWRKGDVVRGGDLFGRARALYDSSQKDRESPGAARTLYLQGWYFFDMGRFQDARQNLEAALQILTARLGPDHMEVGWASLYLGIVLTEIREIPAATELLSRALAIQERTLGSDHPVLPEFLAWLSQAERFSGQRERAREHIDEALEIARRVLPADHPGLASVLYHRGAVLRNTGHPDEALGHFREALAIYEKVLGPQHPHCGWCRNGIGLSLSDLGRPEQAIPYLQQAEAIAEGSYGPQHTDVAQIRTGLAFVLMKLGDLETAQNYLERALAIQQPLFGPGHTRTLSIRYLLARVEARQGNRREALGHLRAVVDGGVALADIPTDPNLATLHGDPEFEVLLTEARRQLAAAAAAGQLPGTPRR